MVEVKICGVCRPEDAREAAAAGADWLGVILAPGRTRSRTVEQAASIYQAAGLRRVGVFVDEAEATILGAAGALSLNAVQLHGNELPASVRRLRDMLGCEVWKAIRVRAVSDVVHAMEEYGGVADALLLDGWSERGEGGTGATFDWEAVAAEVARPAGIRLIAAGGLNSGNVSEAIAALDPAVVDVSSGVESSSGVKSAVLLRSFVATARGVRA